VTRSAHHAHNPFALTLRDWKHVVIHTAKTMSEKDMSLRCAGVAFYGFLSIFPAIGIVVSLVGILGDYGALRAEIDRFSDIMPAIAYSLIATQLDSFMNQDQAGFGVGLAISIVVILWSSSRGVDALLHATSVAYGETSDRGFFISVLVAFATTVLGALFLVVALTLIAAIPIFTRFSPIPGTGEQLALLLRWPALLALAVVAFALIYRYALNRRGAKLRWIWPGATLAALVWIAACLLFSLYVEYFGEFEATFGSLAAAVVMLFWMFISAQIFVFGAALNAGLELRTAVDSTIGPDRPMGKRGAYVADNVET
jgi:membrane protein